MLIKFLFLSVYLSGYVIIEAFLYVDLLHYIIYIPVVINFLTYKTGGKPIQMKKQYITDLFVKVSELANTELRISYSIVEKVKGIDGSFKEFCVTIDTINEEKHVYSSNYFCIESIHYI